MLRAVLSRAPFPAAPLVHAASKVPSRRQRGVARGSAASVTFVSKAKSADLAQRPAGFKAAAGEVDLLLATEAPKGSQTYDFVAGLGNAPSIRDYRAAVTSAVRRAKRLSATRVTLHPPAWDDVSTSPDVFHPARPLSKSEVAEKTAVFAVTGAYEYDRLKSVKGDAPAAAAPRAKRAARQRTRGARAARAARVAQAPPLELIVASTHTDAVRAGAVIGGCVNDCRNLGNLREDEGTPAFYVEWARKHILPEGVRLVKVLRGDQIRQAGLHLLHSVGKGSIHEPYVLVLEYVGSKRSSTSTALVGKGVTFDCGGLNVKPFGSMETMHTDMMGAATVLSTMRAAAQLKLPVNLVGAVGFVENALGPDSYFPSTILTSLKGLTVEVLNTDAEGRLVLADVLTYVQRHARLTKTPTTIIDLATLTGAVIASLGTRRAGLFSNSSRLSEKLMATGTQSGEEVWPLPVGQEHMEAMRGGVADLINSGPRMKGGACTAAAFLANFVEPGVEWAHLDVAGTADVGDKPKGFYPAGVTGFGVQLLIDYLRRK